MVFAGAVFICLWQLALISDSLSLPCSAEQTLWFVVSSMNLQAYTCIDLQAHMYRLASTVSRKTFVRVLFPKSAQRGATGDDLKTQYSDIIEKDLVPNRASPGAVTADDQFDNQIFHKFNRTHGRGAYMRGRDEQEQGASIKMYNFIYEDEHQTRGNKLGILDRAVRSIKMLLARYITETADGKWILYLQDVIDWYNKRQHRSLFTLEEGVDGTKSKRKYWSPNEVYASG